MLETTKSRRLWGELERAALSGRGIDIGCGPDPVPGARGFDVADGDANCITRFVHEQFDFVYSSHCLEHMHDPRQALREWWQLVRPGGHLFFVVPDEDLYEQGVFPSQFNPDHKATFTISKARSWSPRSYNVLDLADGLPAGQLVKLELQDQGYDRSKLRFGMRATPGGLWLARYYGAITRRGWPRTPLIERLIERRVPVDQTRRDDTFAQIACIVRKTG